MDGVIVYDVTLLPHGWTLETLSHVIKEHSIIFYDSSIAPPSALPPYQLDKKPTDKVLVDISTKEGRKRFEEIKKQMEE